MARPDKVAAVEETRERLERSAAAVVTDYRGLSVAELQQLRRALRENDAEYRVVKNTLTRLAARDAGVDIPDELLTGPTALTFCREDPVGPTKVLQEFSRRHPGLVVKGAVFDGQVLGAEDTLRLAELSSREEMLARLAGMMETLVAQPARLARANLEKAARLFAAYREQLPPEPAGEPAAASESGAATADEEPPPAQESPAQESTEASAQDNGGEEATETEPTQG